MVILISGGWKPEAAPAESLKNKKREGCPARYKLQDMIGVTTSGEYNTVMGTPCYTMYLLREDLLHIVIIRTQYCDYGFKTRYILYNRTTILT
jgi:hypothetical protein